MTADWRSEPDEGWFGAAPDDIDPERSVLIGELGYDRPMALDYRVDEPCVRFMTVDARWVKVADSIGQLLQLLEIDMPLASVMGPSCCREHGTTWKCE